MKKAAYKLLLIQPPVQDFYDTPIRLQPLGLAYLKAVTRRELPDFEVVIKDFHHGRGRRPIPLPKELGYLKAYYAYPDKSPFCSFYHYYHFGASFDEIAAEVAAEQPDIIGISSLFSAYSREVIRCAEAIKQVCHAPILVGGSHVSAAPENVLRHKCVDFVIRGEGERPLVEFLRAWRDGGDYADVPNLGLKREGEIVLTPMAANYSIDDLPLPDFSDFPPERYVFERRPLCTIVTSRGCLHHCAFCSVHLTFGATYRRRSNEAILEEIAFRYAQGYRVFDFEDDNLTARTAEMKALCEQLIARFPEGDAQFLAMNGLSYHSLDQELLGLMKRAGFTHLNLSLVTAESGIRRQANRPHSLAQYLEIVRFSALLGFQIVSYHIFGLPYEALESMLDSLAINAELPVLIGASLFYMTPNMPIAASFAEMTEEDIFKARLTAMAHETPYVKRDDLFTLFVTARILDFFKGLKFFTPSISFADALEAAEQNGGRTALGATLLRRLFDENVLYAATGKRLQKIEPFKIELFFRFWSRLHFICTQNGGLITLRS